jgi:hypothetical protein
MSISDMANEARNVIPSRRGKLQRKEPSAIQAANATKKDGHDRKRLKDGVIQIKLAVQAKQDVHR